MPATVLIVLGGVALSLSLRSVVMAIGALTVEALEGFVDAFEQAVAPAPALSV